MNIWLIILAAGLLTYAIRLSFIILWGKVSVPERLVSGLKFVPPAVLSALIFPDLFLNQGHLDVSLSNLRLIAGLLTIIIAWKTRSALLSIFTGFLVLVVLEWVIG